MVHPVPAIVHAAAGSDASDRSIDNSLGNHYSPLAQIDRSNVANLKQAWIFDSGEHGMMETTPLVVDRVLYAATPSGKIVALDGATGKQLWLFDPGIQCFQPIRGLSYWNDGGQGRILVGIMNYLYELDLATGQPIASFGSGGRIDLRENLDTNPKTATVAMTSPGMVYKDEIVVGFRAPETHPAPHGDIRAYDLHTGAMRWTFHTIPHPGEYGYDTWPHGPGHEDDWKNAGAANNWAGMAIDQQRGMVFAPTGSAVDDFYGGDRVGDDLFADTLLALDAETGRRIWHFQDVHHDVQDRDFPSVPALVTVTHEGQKVDAIAQTTKQGYLYLFDRVTGKPLFPIVEEKIPPTSVPGEVSSPTQPHPLAPAPFARQTLTEDDLTNRTPEAHAWALKTFKNFRNLGPFTPFAVGADTVVFPGYDGGAEWGGPAIDARTGVLYVNANEVAWTGALAAVTATHSAGAAVYAGQCAVCHGPERRGNPPDFPSLVGVTSKLTDAQIAELIHNGKGRMPSFPNVQGATLDSVLTFLRTGKDVGPPLQDAPLLHPVALPGTPEAMAANPDGAAVYEKTCAMCHGVHAEGVAPIFPSLIGIGQRLSRDQIAAIVHHGRGKMPPVTTLSDASLKSLLDYLGAPPAQNTPDKQEMAAGGAAQLPRYRFTGYRKFVDPDGYPAISPPWGSLSAIDLNTGKYLWRIPFGEYPALVAQGMQNTGSENYGGPVVTAGGVLFIGATIFDRQMHAYDSATGKLLWHAELPYGGLATPTTYMIDGKQYVVIAAGGGKDKNHALGGVYVAFALP
jgi:glucose dehydrogenase